MFIDSVVALIERKFAEITVNPATQNTSPTVITPPAVPLLEGKESGAPAPTEDAKAGPSLAHSLFSLNLAGNSPTSSAGDFPPHTNLQPRDLTEAAHFRTSLSKVPQ